MFSARQIKLAANVLAEKGWIELARFVDTNALL